MTDQQLFARNSIRKALKAWPSSKSLGKHALSHLHIVQNRLTNGDQTFANTPSGRGIALRYLLQETIEALRPNSAKPDYNDHRWRWYLILKEQFLNGRRAQELRDELGISESGYFNEQRHALDRIGEILREKEQAIQQSSETTVMPNSAEESIITTTLLTLSTMPPSNLPTHPTPFVGRTLELAQIANLLQTDSTRLVSLISSGGMGKTRLAIEAARQLQDDFEQAVYFVPLAPLRTIESVVPTIAKALHLSFTTDGDDDTEQLFNFLRNKRLLLVIDNFEHLMETTQLVSDILHHAPEVKIIATSRERLNLRGEWVLDMHGLTLPEESLDLMQSTAVQLFLHTAQRTQSEHSFTESEYEAIAKICELVAGMPLAIELAASWIHLMPCTEILQEIQKNFDFLEGAFRDLPDRHRSIRAVFDHSWQLLTPHEQTTFRQLSVFRGSFDREAAQAVAKADIRLLHSLTSKSLLKVNNGRYTLHSLLRQYVVEKEEELGQKREQIRLKHANHYKQRLIALYPQLQQGGQQNEALAGITQEIIDIRAAWNISVRQETYNTILEMALPLYLYYKMRKQFREGQEAFSRITNQFQGQLNLTSEQKRVCGIGTGFFARFVFERGRHEHARDLFAQSLTLLEEAGTAYEKAFIGVLSLQADVGGDFEANHIYHKSVTIFQELADEWALAIAHYELGAHILQAKQIFRLYKHRQAQELVAMSLEIQQKIKDEWGAAACINQLGHIAYGLGLYEESQRRMQQSLSLTKRIGDRSGMGDAYSGLGQAVSTRGLYHEALGYYKKCLSLRRELGSLRRIAETLDSLGYVTFLLGNIIEAEQYYQESRKIAQMRHDNYELAWSLHNLGDIARSRGNLTHAKTLYQQSHQLHKELDPFDWGRVVSMEKLGRVTFLMGDHARASDYFTNALQIALRIERYREAVDAALGLARLLGEWQEWETAVLFLAVIINHHAIAKEPHDEAIALLETYNKYINETKRSHIHARAEVVTLTELLETFHTLHYQLAG